MKPAEARAKQCVQSPFRPCSAHEFMAWRLLWPLSQSRLRIREKIDFAEPPLPEPPRPDGLPAAWEWCPPMDAADDEGFWLEPQAEAIERVDGYCGLAGKEGAP